MCLWLSSWEPSFTTALPLLVFGFEGQPCPPSCLLSSALFLLVREIGKENLYLYYPMHCQKQMFNGTYLQENVWDCSSTRLTIFHTHTLQFLHFHWSSESTAFNRAVLFFSPLGSLHRESIFENRVKYIRVCRIYFCPIPIFSSPPSRTT